MSEQTFPRGTLGASKYWKNYLAGPFGGELLALSVEVWRLPEHEQAHARYCRTLRDRGNYYATPSEGRTRPVAEPRVLGELLGHKGCKECGDELFDGALGASRAVAARAKQYASFLDTVRYVTRASGYKNAPVAARTLRGAPGELERRLEHERTSYPTPAYVAALDALSAQALAHREVVMGALGQDAAREQTLMLVRSALVPEQADASEWLLDESPCLIGIGSLDDYLTGVVGSLIAQCSVRAGTEGGRAYACLSAPRYVEAYLRMKLDRAARLSAAPAPSDESLTRVAAQVWEPRGDGRLGSILGALHLAPSLLAE